MPLILGTNSIKDTGYDVANSLRFDDGSSDYLSRTQTSGNKKIFTLSVWLKRTDTLETYIFSAGPNSTARTQFNFNGSSQLMLYNNDGGTVNVYLRTNKLFRDPSAWYHIVLRYDSTQSTASDRVRLYVSGVQETSFATETYPSQNADNIQFNSNTVSSSIGRRHYDNNHHFNGYMSEFVYLDGQSLDPTSFGEFDEDSGIWKPINVSGLTFGTNGFYLDFENSGSLGADVSGNGNNFTVNNLTAIDQTTDTPTNNFCTANPLHFNATIPSANTLSDGNLTFTSSQGSGGYPAMYSTMAVSQGKWYAEFKVTTANSAILGIGAGSLRGGFLGGGYYDYAYYYDGTFYNNGGNTGSQSSYTDGDIISVAMDLDNNKVYVAKNNTWQHSGDPSAGTGGYTITAPASQTDVTGTGVYHFAYGDAGGGTPAIQGNFGNPPFTISSGNTDGNGYGNFEYAVPSGYLSLCTANISEVLG